MAINIRLAKESEATSTIYEVPQYGKMKDKDGNMVEVEQGATRYTKQQLQDSIAKQQEILKAIEGLENK